MIGAVFVEWTVRFRKYSWNTRHIDSWSAEATITMSRAFVLVLKMAALISVLLFGLTIVLACSFVESVYPVPVFLWSKER